MFLLNFYWLSHFLFNLPGAYAARAEPGFSDVDLLRDLSVKLIDGFRMLTYPEQANISPWVAYYYTPVMTMITFGLVAIAGFSFLSPKTRRAAIFPGLLLVVILFLGKGVRGPLSAVGEVIFLSSPYVTRLFRNPGYFETLAVLALALLIGLTIGEIIRIASIKSWKYLTIAVVTVTILLVIYGWQFFIGGPIRSQPKDSPSQTVKVPFYYTELAQFLRDDYGIFRIASLPTFTRQDVFVAYRWKHRFFGVPFLSVWSEKPVLRPLYPMSRGVVNPLFDVAMHPNQDIISQDTWKLLLRMANVRYVTLHKDTDWEYLRRNDTKLNGQRIYKFVAESPYLKKIGIFGKVELYELNSQAFLPLIYPTATPILVKGSLDDMLDVVASDNFTVGNNALFFSNQTSKSQWEFLEKYREEQSNYIPTITFQKINPTRYEVKVESASRPFFLVFSESYYPGWKAYVENEPFKFDKVIAEYDNMGVREARHDMRFTPSDISYLFGKPISEANHFLVNGYANAWYIDPKEVGKQDFTLTLYFLPQSYFYIGLIISGLTLLGCVGYLVFDWRRRRGAREPNKATES